MKELSNLIRVIPTYAVPDTFTGNPTELLSLGYRFHADAIDFNPVPESNGNGETIYNCTTDIVIDTPSNNVFRTYRNALVLLKLSDKDEYIIVGTMTLPARVMIDNNLNKSTLHILCSMLKSPF